MNNLSHTIGILAYNNHDLTIKNVEHLISLGYRGNILLLDNGSVPTYEKSIQKYKIRYLRETKNIYVNPAWNKIFQMENCNYLTLLNNDCFILSKSYFENILEDYNSFLNSDFKPDGTWFEDLLIRRKRHIDQLTLIFKSEKNRRAIQDNISLNLKTRFREIIAGILSLDAKMIEHLEDIKNDQTNILNKINNFHKFTRQNAENVNKAKVVDFSIK